MKNKILSVISIFALTFLTACTPKAIDYEQVSEKEKIVIRFSHVVGEDTPKGQAARLFAKLLKERTNGKVEVQVFSNGSLYKDTEELNALAEGHVQMVAPAISKLTDLIPELGVFDLPYLYPDLNGYHQVLDGTAGKSIAERLKKNHMILLGIWDNGLKQFTNNVKPIRAPEDLAGLTMRIMPSTVLDHQFKMLQVRPVPINFNDVYLALEEGKINGQENTISNIYTKRFYQVQRYMTLSNHGYLGYLVIMNESFWNRLPSDIQKDITDTMRDVTKWERDEAVKIEQEQLKEINKCSCIQIVQLNEAEKERWKQFYQPLYQEMKQKFGPGIFEEFGL
ncbi:C4-dicarboxylate ABC transporter [Collibacillus ludicampi]|uniref:C4-dicarboxylate ABC transporter n=1 Tax=Collibacillus ludicampi TaxID=2771369 RepID=A0AAV4LE04_9BACL|nr:DctP family TRAP transporter solute-binding subunit [Collibacillus ludicampi]GIM45888.1 C4-dicarboxylate ABC transporter [Collibacillus ludicampi]